MRKLKIKRREAILFIIPVAMLGVLPLLPHLSRLAWLNDPRVDDMERTARRLYGQDAIDCGYVRHGDFFQGDGDVLAKKVAADTCALKALRSNKPFRVRYEESFYDQPAVGHNKLIDRYIIGTPSDRIHLLKRVTITPNQKGQQAIQQSQCQPIIKTYNRHQWIECD